MATGNQSKGAQGTERNLPEECKIYIFIYIVRHCFEPHTSVNESPRPRPRPREGVAFETRDLPPSVITDY